MTLQMIQRQMEIEKDMPDESRTIPKDLSMAEVDRALDTLIDPNSEATVRKMGEDAPEGAVNGMILNQKMDAIFDRFVDNIDVDTLPLLPDALEIASKQLAG